MIDNCAYVYLLFIVRVPAVSGDCIFYFSSCLSHSLLPLPLHPPPPLHFIFFPISLAFSLTSIFAKNLPC